MIQMYHLAQYTQKSKTGPGFPPGPFSMSNQGQYPMNRFLENQSLIQRTG